MGWEILIPIIAREGIPAAMRLWTLWKTGGEPTQKDWDELAAISKKSYDDYIAYAKKGG
ncbi:MAG: hypothetical protein H0U18_17730 [Pyrinomonadaceae bacterium]|nr:hypothetical protein [Pyrinomonadaceae bacterium]